MGKVENEVLDVNDVEVENTYLIVFSETYNFEDEKITELDLRGMNDLTASDMLKANKQLERGGGVSFMPEISLEYALILAAIASKRPIEFFKILKPRDTMKVKNKVIGFLFGSD